MSLRLCAKEAKNWFQENQENYPRQRIIQTKLACEAGHHRLEKRRFLQVPVEKVFSKTQIAQWTGLETLVIEQSSRTLWNKTTYSTRFFLSSLSSDFANFPGSIRSHWGIENQCSADAQRLCPAKYDHPQKISS